MTLLYRYLFSVMWLSWAAYWWALSRNVKVTARHEPLWSRLLHVIPLVLAGLLLWVSKNPSSCPRRSLSSVDCMAILGWRRADRRRLAVYRLGAHPNLQIGRNWSGIVTIKEGHELITSGPYAIVRHPIYTGLLLAFVGSALARAEWRGILAVVIALWALWRKLRFEERWMREQFGESYQAYSQRVAALVPFLL